MKSLARGYVWWPTLTKDIEEHVKTCNACQLSCPLPPATPLHPWDWPRRPWVRIHIDYAGPFLGQMFLIVGHSKWLDICRVSSATSTATISALRSIFSSHGLPDIIVSDNGSVFTSQDFQEFTKKNGIRHVTSAPYHPATNGLAERAVQTFKNFMKKSSTNSLETRLSRFLFQYRITPHSSTGVSPAELLMGRRLLSHLDLVFSNLATRVEQHQGRQKASHDKRSSSDCTLAVGDDVYAKGFCEACSVECNFSFGFCNYDYVMYSTYHVISQIHVLQKNIWHKVNLL